MTRAQVIRAELDDHGLEFVGFVAKYIFHRSHGHIGREHAVKPRGGYSVSRKHKLCPRDVQHIGTLNVAVACDKSARLASLSKSNAPLSFRMAQREDQTFLRGGVYDTARSEPQGQHSGSWRQSILPSTVEHHPR